MVLLKVGARGSRLSRVQTQEILSLLHERKIPISFEPIWVETSGDKDKKISLRGLEKSNIFTKELDAMLLKKECQITVHSAKDLPDPIPEGISCICITKGKDPRDALVFQENANPEALKMHSIRVGTSSERREDTVKMLYPNAIFSDIRGTIEERLSLITKNIVDAVVVAEAALLRLELDLNRIYLPGTTAEKQGQLAVLARDEDVFWLQPLFSPIHHG